MNFNPRSHERSDIEAAAKTAIMGISIHAPTRGATNSASAAVLLSLIFQSTLPREERPYWSPLIETLGIFQSTLPREERPDSLNLFFYVLSDFNPRSHERSDGFYVACLIFGADFNPRSHERSDCFRICNKAHSLLFQSTLPREERLITRCHRLSNLPISIHAPTRGATPITSTVPPAAVYFNPRSHERSDQSLWKSC